MQQHCLQFCIRQKNQPAVLVALFLCRKKQSSCAIGGSAAVMVASHIQQYWWPLPCCIAIVSVALFPSPQNQLAEFFLCQEKMKQATCSIVDSVAVVAMPHGSSKATSGVATSCTCLEVAVRCTKNKTTINLCSGCTCVCFLLVPVAISTLFAALCVVHGCTHTTSMLRQQNATAAITNWLFFFFCTQKHAGQLWFCCFLWQGNRAPLLPWPLPHALQSCFAFCTHHATNFFI